MSLNVTFNGSMYIIPETGEVGWGGNTTSYLVAIAAGALQKTGGSFTLSAEIDFGASFGVKSLYYKSHSANIAAAGILRLNNNSDSVSWRNFANSGDLPLTVDASDRLSYNGVPVLTGTGPTDYVSSITGTANQVIASAATGAVTLSLPQSIHTGAAVQFGTLALGGTLSASAILSLASTSLGFLPPRMTTVQRNAIATPATGLLIYNTTTNQYDSYNGTSWVALAMSGGGTVSAGVQFQLGYYAVNGTTLSGLPLITPLRAIESDANGLPVASAVTATELAYVSGVTSAIQTQLNLKAPLASPTFTGTVTIPTPFTLGAISVTATGTELNYSVGVTSGIQTQLNTKATDSLVVHLAGTETITGAKTFSNVIAITTTTSPYLTADASIAGQYKQQLTNTSTGANASSGIEVVTQPTATGTADPFMLWTISGGQSFIAGIDNSASDVFEICAGATLGTNIALQISTLGVTSIQGTVSNDSATAGFVGEYIESVAAATAFPATGTFGDLTSISLTAGDWDVSLGMGANAGGSTTISGIYAGISTTSGNSTTGLVFGSNYADNITPPVNGVTQAFTSIPVYRISLSATTTVYYKYRANYTNGTPTAAGRLSARRVR